MPVRQQRFGNLRVADFRGALLQAGPGGLSGCCAARALKKLGAISHFRVLVLAVRYGKERRTALHECNSEDRHRSPCGGDARLGTGGACMHGRRLRRHRHEPALYAQRRRKGREPRRTRYRREAVLGVVSLIFWSLIIVISIKYAILIMRADNHGEGGILALLALISPRRAKQSRRRAIMVVIGLVGATLLYGDGTITPAISVLSAIEGIKVYAPQMEHAVVPLTVAILALLFIIQRNGTSWIGGIFGPVMLIWFVVAGVLGIVGIARAPAVLAALSPLPAITYLWHAGPLAFVVIGGAFLAVTGGEAFYADMGHFGPFPIRARLVRRGVAGAHPQLFRPRRTAAHRARRHRQPVLSARPGMVALPSGRSGDRRPP